MPGRQALSSGADQTSDTAQLTALRHAAGAMIRAILIMSSLAGAMVSTPRLRAQDVGDYVEIIFRAPHAIDATCFGSCACAMAWRFHAIDATLSPWPLGSMAWRLTKVHAIYLR